MQRRSLGYFGKFGNYGLSIAYIEEGSAAAGLTQFLSFEAHAYGDFIAEIKAYSPTPEEIEKLGKQLIILAEKLKTAKNLVKAKN